MIFEFSESSFNAVVPGDSVPASAGYERGMGSIPALGRSLGGGNGNLLLPGKSYGQRNLVGYSPWDCKELDTTELLSVPAHVGIISKGVNGRK